ncbi:alpha-glucuronidase [Sphingomonas gilva]|uniref:Xylan alpha-1,2-glucuronidase n=1 Tax=Sphingomonas gilva TaxID=2305907 RepID=A0A396RMN5_9SPHN|nr:alpha-glucuronidase family glycosyl hydrolase [Sphingomonas gilva]RHW17569.1 alpha-glucuronidase [Sphingomonas gilva]
MRLIALLAFAIALLFPVRVSAEDGYDLWLRYRALEAGQQDRIRPHATALVSEESDPTIDRIAAELGTALGAMLGAPPPARRDAPAGAIVFGTPKSPRIAALGLPLGKLGREGYLIRSVAIDGKPVTVIAGNTSIGALYGAFRFIRLIQLGEPIDRLDIADRPRLDLRLLNHWDNLDRHVERGYAGQSIWDWQKLPGFADPRYTDYARANASIGINGTVLNNVNSNADILTEPFLKKVAKLADIFRPYGIRVYLSARFSAPIEIGGLKTADPLDPEVAAWWKAKADEIYRHVPDFGGFLVKANSEGQPGPQDYGRSHAEGANMLAAAVRPHGGVVMWRAFVYANENPDDRAKQAYSEFQPLDGTFADNVIVQVKNGPIDFQPREPFHPLFGAMPKTPLMMEFQITKEYLGFATHLVYLGGLWEEVLRADTHRPRAGTTVADVLDTPVRAGAPTGIAGVANIGNDRNWSGSQFDQANWYAFGRLAWNPDESGHAIAADWSRMTWGDDPALTSAITGMMLRSHQAVVDYMTPLGLNHLMATGHHYGPGPWVDDLPRRDWNPTYFHDADAAGIGFDRTRTGSNAVAQYAAPVARRFGSLATVGDDYLLWFHHVPWDHRMASGRTLWDELVVRYDRGVAEVAAMQQAWAALAPKIDARRHREVSDFLAIQREEAKWWRDACIAYFGSIAKRPLPAGHAAPPHDLQYYKAIRHPYAPGN